MTFCAVVFGKGGGRCNDLRQNETSSFIYIFGLEGSHWKVTVTTKCSTQSQLVKEALQVFITQEHVARMLFHFPQNMKNNEYWYNNLMQGTCSCNNFVPVKFNELSCPHICVKWILRLSKSVPLLFWAPAAYQDSSMCHGWPVKKYIYIYRTTPVT